MPANTNTGYLLNPTTVIAPDLAVQQQQVQRQQDLIDALRGQSLQPIDGGRGAVSWTQGAAKLADALAARVMQKRNDKQSVAMSQAMASRLGPMFGLPAAAGTPQATALANALAPKGGDPASAAGPIMVNPTAVGGSPVPPSAPLSPPVAPQAPAPDASPATSPPLQAPQPQAGGSYPMSLSGNPQQDFMNYAMDPQEFMKARIAASAPVDVARLVQQAQAAAERGDMATASALYGKIAHDNYLAPISVRGNSAVLDPVTHQPIFYNPQVPDGAAPAWNANGQPTGVSMLPGAADAIGVSAGAKAGAEAAAKAPFDLVEVVDTQGNKHFVPKSTLTGGGAPAPAAPGGAPARGTGPLAKHYGQAGGLPPVSAQSPADIEAGKIAAKNFSDAINSGSGSQQANYQLDRIAQITKDLPTGQGSGVLSGLKSAVNAATGHNIFDADQIAKFDELKKISSSLAQTLSQGAGMNGTDARLQAAIDSLPNSNYSPKAIQGVVVMLKGLQTASQARGQAAATWQQGHGAASFPAFQREWQKNYDPVLFEHIGQGPQAVAQWAKDLPAEQRAQALSKYRALKAMGAF